MSYFNLPISTVVNRFIPKNAFNEFANAKQKQRFVEVVDKIFWLNKLSKETINLAGKEIAEIQIFELKLKGKLYPKDLLDIIDKAIPYQIIFILSYSDLLLLSTSKKHNHPIKQDNSVLDWSFSTDWFINEQSVYQLNLKISLDFIYADFCAQLSNYISEQKDINNIIDSDKKIKGLKKQISELQGAIKTEKQFNKKVELNLLLLRAEEELKSL
jgi:hypothetical protein